jgi:ribonuclease HII
MKLDKTLEYAPPHLSEVEFICGIDECGRGCGAGPVVTAAVILPKGFKSELIRDSKKLSEKQRNEAYHLIINNALSYSCLAGSVKDIDELGINVATFNTMHRCLDALLVKPSHILVDGTTWKDYNGENSAEVSLIPKGDDTYTSIAAAAIIAKVRRDEYMVKLHGLFPAYNWESNKGYLSPEHISALKEIGSTKYHRTLYIKNFTK